MGHSLSNYTQEQPIYGKYKVAHVLGHDYLVDPLTNRVTVDFSGMVIGWKDDVNYSILGHYRGGVSSDSCCSVDTSKLVIKSSKNKPIHLVLLDIMGKLFCKSRLNVSTSR